jgi:hypothetical protein
VLVLSQPSPDRIDLHRIYYDLYHPPRGEISPVSMKEMRFAYQRELRFVADPGRGLALAEEAFTMTIGSIQDIAAVYDPKGNRIVGMGPNSFLA